MPNRKTGINHQLNLLAAAVGNEQMRTRGRSEWDAEDFRAALQARDAAEKLAVGVRVSSQGMRLLAGRRTG